jgi:hypothetical protein
VLLTDLQFRLHYPDDGSVGASFSLAKVEGILLASVIAFTGGYMLWLLAVVMGGLSLGYVTVRRRRKAEQKHAKAA